MPNFDLELGRVIAEHYITGKAAINFPWLGTTTGGWQHLPYWNIEAGLAKVSLAGIHYPNMSEYLGSMGIGRASTSRVTRRWRSRIMVWQPS